ncbi:hypothetical protein ABZ626_35730 [Streptomyces longispororuber]|uniref:hypothetical protein n=1 Tax=Streptomyces longispororuber TaxID=68230 RepID=UPI0033D3E751
MSGEEGAYGAGCEAAMDTGHAAAADTSRTPAVDTGHDAGAATNHDTRAVTGRDAHAPTGHNTRAATGHDAHGATGHDTRAVTGHDTAGAVTGRDAADVAERVLDGVLAAAHHRVGIAVHDRLMGQGGLPELRDPDLALDRMLATAHRQSGLAVTARLAREAAADQPRTERGPGSDAGGALMRRPAAVRLKYRLEALEVARALCPGGLLESLQAALRQASRLAETLDADVPPVAALAAASRLRVHLARVRLPPAPRRRPAPVIGSDYLTAVEEFLAPGAEHLVRSVRDVRLLLDEEFAPCLADAVRSGPSPGAGVVAQDLVDDVADAHEQAVALRRSAAEVERACTDFVGADLRAARLDGVQLEGIRWDAATLWPEEWEPLIRRASLPVGGERGVLVVAAEPYDSVVSADA